MPTTTRRVETCQNQKSVLVHGCMGLTTLFTLKMMMIKMINTRKINLMDANAFRTNVGGKDQDALCKLKGRIPLFRWFGQSLTRICYL